MRTVGLLIVVFTAINLFAQKDQQLSNKVLDYQTGTIQLGNGMAQINLGKGYKYLNPSQTDFVLVNLWGNPPDLKTMGMILPAGWTPADTDSWAVVVRYEEEGYVKDKDAIKIDYDGLLKKMQKATTQRNEERLKNGYESIDLVGWAEKPFYDSAAKKLYWAKELKFGNNPENTLNYDVRILGRKGYLVLTVVSKMGQISAIKPFMPEIVRSADFLAGHRYSEFDPKVDKVAAYGIAGLVAGGLLVKAGFFKLIIAGIIALKKFIIIGLIALVAVLSKFFRKKSVEETYMKQ